jgi:hypothetical protein
MKRLLITASIIAFAFFPFLASAQGISQLQQWKTAGANYLQPLSNAYGLLVPGLATSSTGCLTIASNGWISATGSLCGSGSGGSGFATTSADYWLTTKTTSNVTEGSNLYFTNARSDVRFITDLAGTTSVKSIATLPSLSLPYSQLTGTPIIASSTLLSDSNTFSGVDLFTNSSSNFAGTWQTFSPSHFQTALSLTADSLVYTDHSGILTTVASSSLDLPNGALQNSSITVNSTTFNLGDSKTITAASSTLFSDFDTFAHTITGSVSGSAGSVANAITFNNSGSGASSGSTFNGSGALTVSYNTIGAQVAGTYATFGYPFTTATGLHPVPQTPS